MDGMNMGDMGMGGMDMGTSLFQEDNMALARAFWYIIAGVLVLLLLIRGVNFAINWTKLRSARTTSAQYPTRPTTRFAKAWATTTAVVREISYPQIYVPGGRWVSWLTPPPLGRIVVLLAYWAVIAYMMSSNAVVGDALFWERIGFRNAWVTITQMPLLFLLATKTNPIGLIVGTGYERLNWLHRWVARTMFVTATVHGFHFWTEWVLADFVDFELQAMPIVKYGLGAWAVLLWMVVTSLKPFRSMAYEVWVVQHIVAAVFFIWTVNVHIPDYARYNVWFSVAIVAFDRAARWALMAWQNVKARPNPSRCRGGQRLGHQAQVAAVGDAITVLTIKDVHFRWRAGQHLYLWLPRIGPLEAHPYTIACPHQVPDTCICNSIQLVIRAHSGFSRRLHNFAKKARASETKQTLTAFVAGPYGVPPRWDVFETLVLISASTGASFTLPILESVLRADQASVCTRRVDFLLAARQGDEVGFYLDRLHESIALARDRGIELSVHIAITGAGQLERLQSSSSSSQSSSGLSLDKEKGAVVAETKATAVDVSTDIEKIAAPSSAAACCSAAASSGPSPRKRTPSHAGSTDSHIQHSTTRPDVAALIRGAVEATGGETGVVVCGGASLVARCRTSVAKLSDERAVHKGTGAQGIYLHVEEYCF